MKNNVLGALSVIILLLALCSCSIFGRDSVDYSIEPVVGAVEKDGDVWREIEDMLYTLTVDSADIPEFDSMKDSSELCRESLLNYMFGRNYDKYSGNTVLLEKIKKDYPQYNVICAIPREDYESEMYRLFGGSVKIVHKSCSLFTYLPTAEVYVPVAVPVVNGVTLILDSAEETEHTYRISFTAEASEMKEQYIAVLIKRDDGTVYFDAVLAK